MKAAVIIIAVCGMCCLCYGGYLKGVKATTQIQEAKIYHLTAKIDSITAELENYKLLYKIAEP